MGALDVCPFVPVRGVSMDQCVLCAQDFGQRLAEELKVPGGCWWGARASPCHADPWSTPRSTENPPSAHCAGEPLPRQCGPESSCAAWPLRSCCASCLAGPLCPCSRVGCQMYPIPASGRGRGSQPPEGRTDTSPPSAAQQWGLASGWNPAHRPLAESAVHGDVGHVSFVPSLCASFVLTCSDKAL